jgi:hypothetical protein
MHVFEFQQITNCYYLMSTEPAAAFGNFFPAKYSVSFLIQVKEASEHVYSAIVKFLCTEYDKIV